MDTDNVVPFRRVDVDGDEIDPELYAAVRGYAIKVGYIGASKVRRAGTILSFLDATKAGTTHPA